MSAQDELPPCKCTSTSDPYFEECLACESLRYLRITREDLATMRAAVKAEELLAEEIANSRQQRECAGTALKRCKNLDAVAGRFKLMWRKENARADKAEAALATAHTATRSVAEALEQMEAQRDEARVRSEKAERLLMSALCSEKGCAKQAECFGTLNEGSHTKLLAGCREHMPSIVKRSSIFACMTSGDQIVERTLLVTSGEAK